MLQNRFKLATLITVLCSAGASMVNPDVSWAEDASDIELAPLVMIIIDTSNSMNMDFECKDNSPIESCGSDCVKCKNDKPLHTRLSKAIAQIAGTPKGTTKLDRECDNNVSNCYLSGGQACNEDTNNKCYKNPNRPRKYWDCTGGNCSFKYKEFPISDAKTKSRKDRNGNPLSESLVSHLDSTLYNEKNYADYENAYNNDGVLQAYQYAVKFGFASMCTSRSSTTSGHVNSTEFAYKYSENNTSKYTVNGVDGCGPEIETLTTAALSNIHSSYPSSDKISDVEGICSGKVDNVNNLAPLIYPTVSDDENDIYEYNSAVISSIRSYSGFSSTPILGALRDFRALFGDENGTDKDGKIKPNADKCMYTQKIKKDGTFKEVEDEHYLCRPKAIIFITDGDNYWDVFLENDKSCTGNTYCSKLENFKAFARDLYDNNVKIYPVGFAEGFPVDSGTKAGKKLNYMAWKGGTCLKDDGTLIPADDTYTEAEFNTLVTQKKLIFGDQCFYDARDANKLRLALSNALSDMLKAFKSRTRIATTTALGRVKNFDGTYYHNGYYNVYSGYNIAVGQVRTTILERETQLCDRDNPTQNGFKADSSQFIDMATRLTCRLTGCATYKTTEAGFLVKSNDLETAQRAGYMSDEAEDDDPTARPAPCATDYDQTNNLFGSISYTSVNTKNTCSSKRNIFAGDYTQDRYGINPAAYSILKPTSTLDATNDLKTKGDGGFINAPIYAGYIHNGQAENSNYQFIIHNPTEAENQTCAERMTHPYTESNSGTADYILSPYECITALDCPIISRGKPLECDLGRCVNPDDYKAAGTCTANENNKVCIANRLREKHSECNNHLDCVDRCSDNGTTDGGCVCHAGQCVPGIVKNCDIRQFLATQKLGTIEYASPTVVEPPNRNYKSTTYKDFKEKYWTRDTMLMVGANDGMLHSFILGNNGFAKYEKAEDQNTYALSDAIASKPSAKNAYGEGDELWGFIPKGVMPNLANLINFGPQQHVNSTPITSDVLSPIDKEWHTVVLGGLGNGGRSYYALDVSNPAQPKILWEIDHQWQPWTSPEYPDMTAPMSKIIEGITVDGVNTEMGNRERLESNAGYPFQLLGKAVIEPAITTLNIDGTLEPVAIIPAGQGTNETDDRLGCALYIVRLFPADKEHLLVKTFYFDDPITSTPSVYPNNFNAIGQLIYVGDKKGALYRLDVSSPDVADWSGETKSADGTLLTEKNSTNGHEPPIFDPSSMGIMGNTSYDAITFKPAVSLYSRTGSTVIQLAFGTGTQHDFSIDTNDHNYIANFYDSCTPSSIVRDGEAVNFYSCTLNPSGGTFASQIRIFNPPSGVTNNNSATEGTQTFKITTYTDISNQYQKMTGPAVTYNFYSYYPVYTVENTTCALGHAGLWRLYSPNSPRHSALSSNIQTTNNKTESAAFSTDYIQLGSTGTKVYGLQITNQMVCLSKDQTTSKVIAPQLIAQTGRQSSFEASASAKDSRLTIPSMALDLEPIAPSIEIVSWASVYE